MNIDPENRRRLETIHPHISSPWCWYIKTYKKLVDFGQGVHVGFYIPPWSIWDHLPTSYVASMFIGGMVNRSPFR